MFTQKKEIKQSVDEYRKRFVRLVAAQEEDIDELVNDTRDDIGSLISRNVSGNSIDEDRVVTGLKAAFALWAVNYLSTLVKFNARTGGLVAEQQVNLIDDRYDDPGLTNLMNNRVKNFEADFTKTIVTRKYPTDGVSVGTRIKTIQAGALKTSQDIIRVGINEGKSARAIAADLDNWILPSASEKWTGPFDWFRTRFGYKVKRVPLNRPAGSLYFNSVRIARTEINYTYRRATILANKNQPWVKGYLWNLSGSHPKADVCDDWEKGNPYKDYREVDGFGHPYCMCYITIDLYKPGEV